MWALHELVQRRWDGDAGSLGGRRARQGFTSEAFLPDPIATLDPAISFRTAGTVVDAEDAIRLLNAGTRRSEPRSGRVSSRCWRGSRSSPTPES